MQLQRDFDDFDEEDDEESVASSDMSSVSGPGYYLGKGLE